MSKTSVLLILAYFLAWPAHAIQRRAAFEIVDGGEAVSENKLNFISVSTKQMRAYRSHWWLQGAPATFIYENTGFAIA